MLISLILPCFLFDNLAYTKFMLHESSSDAEYTKHDKSTLKAGCYIFWVKTWKRCRVFSNGASFNTNGPVTLKFHIFEERIQWEFLIFASFKNEKVPEMLWYHSLWNTLNYAKFNANSLTLIWYTKCMLEVFW